MLPAQPNQSLLDGIRCLEDVAGRGRAVGVRELGRELGLEPTRVHRLLRTLAHLGLVQQQPDRRYAPGPAVHVLASLTLFASGLMRRAWEPLERLRRHGHVVAMGVLWRDHVSYLYHAGPGTPPGEGIGRTALFPASRSSIGRVLLAGQGVAQVRALYRGRPVAGVVGGASGLLRELGAVRRDGYALVANGTDLSLAVPVGSPPVAAIALAGRWKPREQKALIESLQDAAHRMTTNSHKENTT